MCCIYTVSTVHCEIAFARDYQVAAPSFCAAALGLGRGYILILWVRGMLRHLLADLVALRPTSYLGLSFKRLLVL